MSVQRFATYGAEATARQTRYQTKSCHERDNAAHRLSKRTVCVSAMTEPARATRAMTVAATENCIVKCKKKRLRQGGVKEER